MCTIMAYPETLPAEKRSRKDSQLAVDQLMEYDRRLSEPFSREELTELFSPEHRRYNTADYDLLTEAEKAIVEELGLTPKPGETSSRMSDDPWLNHPRMSMAPVDQPESVDDRRRKMKAGLIDTPTFNGGFGWGRDHTGHIYVWLDNMSFGNSDKTGFYYVRYQRSMLWMGTTAYAHPALIVQKSKLRPDQVEYMERKCRETREAAGRGNTRP